MDNISQIYEKELKNEEENLTAILEEIAPLARKKAIIEKNIESLKHLISSKKEIDKPISISESGSLAGKTGTEAYRELSKDYLRGEPFRERQIRELSIKEGLRIKGQPIARPYSRTIIRDLLDSGFLEKVDRGLFRYKQENNVPLVESERINLEV